MVDGARCLQDPALEQQASEPRQPAAQAEPALSLSRSMGNAAFGSAIAGSTAVPAGAVHRNVAELGNARRMARTGRRSPRGPHSVEDVPLNRGLARAARERRALVDAPLGVARKPPKVKPKAPSKPPKPGVNAGDGEKVKLAAKDYSDSITGIVGGASASAQYGGALKQGQNGVQPATLPANVMSADDKEKLNQISLFRLLSKYCKKFVDAHPEV